MDLSRSVAFVTGANRGLGLAFVRALQEAGVQKIYAAARDPASIKIPGVIPVKLDVTKADQVAAAVKAAPDVSLLINNAGIFRAVSFLADNAIEAARDEFETNFFGPLALSKAFAPVLAEQGGGAIVNVLSVLSWLNVAGAATYSASKAAAWSLTNGLRQELKPQHTAVLGLHVGYMDTDMAAGAQGPKTDPADVARQVLQALKEGRDEVAADELSRNVKAGLSAGSYRSEV
ncbi:short chain dehydrogenase [Roseateles sp. YR242]|uniref:SDR family oxidoreductase n=1 Tax=Roseateles sp. YR242 TaxID=1855305 RepID=UPI0008B10036|nr:SDR family oxidoreductase [Roseateles sp. YR242]SEL84495.1 short chain dehydrogenase [Roseateles sp. YR242]